MIYTNIIPINFDIHNYFYIFAERILIMTRQEFCNMLAEMRQKSNKKMTEICAVMGVLPTAIYRLEKNYNNFEIDKALAYIKALDVELYLQGEGSEVLLNSSADFSNWLKNIRKGLYSQRSLAEKVGCAYLTIANIERGATVVRIETLLKLISIFNYCVTIK